MKLDPNNRWSQELKVGYMEGFISKASSLGDPEVSEEAVHLPSQNDLES